MNHQQIEQPHKEDIAKYLQIVNKLFQFEFNTYWKTGETAFDRMAEDYPDPALLRVRKWLEELSK